MGQPLNRAWMKDRTARLTTRRVVSTWNWIMFKLRSVMVLERLEDQLSSRLVPTVLIAKLFHPVVIANRCLPQHRTQYRTTCQVAGLQLNAQLLTKLLRNRRSS